MEIVCVAQGVATRIRRVPSSTELRAVVSTGPREPDTKGKGSGNSAPTAGSKTRWVLEKVVQRLTSLSILIDCRVL
jgi:hypothetical protein